MQWPVPFGASWDWPLIGSFIVGASGVLLGVWNRVDQVRDRRKAAQAALPKAEIDELGSRVPQWCHFRVLFHSQTPVRFRVLSVEGKGWTFAPSKQEFPDRPAYDPGPDTADLEHSAKVLQLGVDVNIDPSDGGVVYSNLYFWGTSKTFAANRPAPPMYLNCRWAWGKRAAFRLTATLKD